MPSIRKSTAASSQSFAAVKALRNLCKTFTVTFSRLAAREGITGCEIKALGSAISGLDKFCLGATASVYSLRK
jgi:hypothetical protein